MQTIMTDALLQEGAKGYPSILPGTHSVHECDQLRCKKVDLDLTAPSKLQSPQHQAEPEPSPNHLAATDSEEDHNSESDSMQRQASSTDSEPMAEEATFENPKTSSQFQKGASQLIMPECLLKTVLSGQRFRKSCYFNATVRYGLKSTAPYNHMLLPVVFSSVEEEYENLKTNVCLWDVAVQRQIEVRGPDAFALVDILTPRGISAMKVGECRYAIMTDDEAMVINDPVLLKLAEDRYWFSIADTDMLFWIKGLALGRGLDVRVTEVDVSPLAVQGPKSRQLLQDMFGEWVADLKYYHFKETELDGIPMLVSRSGWSPELGYELYLQDESRGDELWEKVMAAGQKYSIMPGAPNQIRRIEGGMLVHGSDITLNHNILELGLPPKFCSSDKAADFLGKAAIKRLIDEGGPKRRIMGLEFHRLATGNDKICPFFDRWYVRAGEAADADRVGFITTISFSPAFDTYLAFATLSIESCIAGLDVWVELPSGETRCAVVRKLPFLPRAG